MNLNPCFLLLSVTAVCVAAQSHCDPLTQYEFDGKCCTKCGPGTSMLAKRSCESPQCVECDDDEYQETFTTETTCQRQPYCDPNKNFQWAVHESKKKRSVCRCADGFHCSSSACLTCVPHSRCAEGSGAQSKGNQTHDTVCAECPDGTFSSNSSWNDVCHKWKTCPDGFYVHQKGTKVSDNTCERRTDGTVWIVLPVIVILALSVTGLLYCKKRGDKKWNVARRLKMCCRDELEEEEGEEGEEEGEGPRDEESGRLNAPVESEDEPMTIFSDNGNVVAQDVGKSEILSEEESNQLARQC